MPRTNSRKTSRKQKSMWKTWLLNCKIKIQNWRKKKRPGKQLKANWRIKTLRLCRWKISALLWKINCRVKRRKYKRKTQLWHKLNQNISSSKNSLKKLWTKFRNFNKTKLKKNQLQLILLCSNRNNSKLKRSHQRLMRKLLKNCRSFHLFWPWI